MTRTLRSLLGFSTGWIATSMIRAVIFHRTLGALDLAMTALLVSVVLVVVARAMDEEPSGAGRSATSDQHHTSP